MIRKRGWAMLVVPAIAPEDVIYRIGPRENDIWHRKAGEVLLPRREPLEVLERLKIDLGSSNYAAQYDQNPIPPGAISSMRIGQDTAIASRATSTISSRVGT